MRCGSTGTLLVIAALLLQGCAVPPIVAIASYSADIVSYAATGKTVTDHAYSAVARSDCSFIRILKDKPICIDNANRPVETAAASPAPPAVATAPVPPRDRYVAIGSFLMNANAERTVARYAAFHPVIEAVEVEGRHFHRVVAGPLSSDEAAALKARMVAAGRSRARSG